MFDFLCYKPIDSYAPKQDPTSYMRILQASPACRNVDVYSNGHLLTKSLGFKKFTPYLSVPTGIQQINIYKSGNRSKPIISRTIGLKAGEICTGAAIGEDSQTELLPVPDPKLDTCEDMSHIRFSYLSPDGPEVNIIIHGGHQLFGGMNYKDVSKYIQITPGRYTFQLRASSDARVLSTASDIELKPGWNYTIYAIGYAGRKPGLQILVPLDGNTYIKF